MFSIDKINLIYKFAQNKELPFAIVSCVLQFSQWTWNLDVTGAVEFRIFNRESILYAHMLKLWHAILAGCKNKL